MVKCVWYKIYKHIFNSEINREECLLIQEKSSCGGDTHNCDYPMQLAIEQKAGVADKSGC